jgi:hypothetical protein
VSTTTVPKVAGSAHPRAHSFADLVRATQLVRRRAAVEMRHAFPGDLDRYAFPGLPRTTLSRARMGSTCAPAYRFGLLILAIWWGGGNRAEAQRLVDAAQDLVDLLFPIHAAPSGRPVLHTMMEELRAARHQQNRVLLMLERAAVKEASAA